MKSILFMLSLFCITLHVTAQNYDYAGNLSVGGNLGIRTTNPNFYYHGGSSNIGMEIFNAGTDLNSQAHIILSTGATANVGSVGTLSWMTPNSTGNKGVAYIGAIMTKSTATNASGELTFATANDAIPTIKMRIDASGNVGIGSVTSSNYKLAVEGTIGTRKIKVTQQPNWADFVFQAGYQLPSLQEVENYINVHQHLSGIPTAEEVKKDGVDLAEINVLLLQKVEEITLYLIELKKENTELKQKHHEVLNRIAQLEKK